MKYVMTYYAAADFLPLAREHGPAHRARLHEFQARGQLLMAGPLDDPPTGDAIGVFRTRDAAEEFIEGDPFVRNGVVERWTIRPWHEILAP
jgi:uncharacterized protein YciI